MCNTKFMKIIIVEDELDLLEMVTEICEDLGYEVSGFSTPVEALARIVQMPNSDFMVISDYNLPSMNGQEMMKQMRARVGDVPFLFWSGHWDESLRATLLALRNIHVFDKPFDIGEFRRLISEIAGPERMAAEFEAAG